MVSACRQKANTMDRKPILNLMTFLSGDGCDRDQTIGVAGGSKGELFNGKRSHGIQQICLGAIREKRFSSGLIGLNYHKWSVCECARKKGRELDLPVYKFLKDPLVRRFGQEWYDELETIAKELDKMMG